MLKNVCLQMSQDLAWVASTRVEELRHHFRESTQGVGAGSPLMVAFVPVVAISLGLAIYFLWSCHQRTLNTAAHLFRELCQRHGLVPAQRRLLEDLAHAAGLPQPAALLVRPDLFDAGAERLQASSWRGERQAAALQTLRARLFATAESS